MTTKSEERYIESVGKRKSSIARVRITPASTSTYIVNDKKMDDYFDVDDSTRKVRSVLGILKEKLTFKVSVSVIGGGVASQADAIVNGLAKAIVKHDAKLKKELKDAGFLTRDARIKERRKFGLKKARKAAQWSKR